MSDLRELYQTVILDHNRRPRNVGRPEGANREADGVNPICGDKVHVYARVEDDVVADVGFEGSGCVISVASASLMTEAVKGRPRSEVEALFHRFQELVTGQPAPDRRDGPELGKLEVLAGVREFPMRVKCATLPWHALAAALEQLATSVSTE